MGNLARNDTQNGYCTLPIQNPVEDSIKKAIDNPQRAKPKPLVLIIEDDKISRILLRTKLKELNPDKRIVTVKNYDIGKYFIDKVGYFVETILADNRLGQGKNKRGSNLVEYAKNLYPHIDAILISNSPEDIRGTRFEQYFKAKLPPDSKREFGLIQKILEN